MSLQVTIPIPNAMLDFLLGIPISDDDAEVIGISTVAYLNRKEPASVFLPAAIWHDAATAKGSSIEGEWPMWKVNNEFLKKMLDIAVWEAENRPVLTQPDREALLYELRLKAFYLTMLVDKYRKSYYEGAML